MFVLCPHCQFLVGLEPGSASPPERCPRCRQPLQASPAPAPVETLSLPPTMEPQVPGAPPAHDATTAAPDEPVPEQGTGDVAMTDGDATADPGTTPIAGELTIAPDPVSINDAAATGDPAVAVIAGDPAARSTRSRAWWPSVAVRRWIVLASIPLLLILLVVQSLLSDRTRLAADARWRPTVAAACGVLGCELPAWHEPEAFTLLDRDVRPNPAIPGVLHVTAVFRNDARWPQPLPSLMLTLSDADGRIAGERLFAPAEYLADAPHTQKGLARGQSARVTLDVVEPPQGVVAFTFDLR